MRALVFSCCVMAIGCGGTSAAVDASTSDAALDAAASDAAASDAASSDAASSDAASSDAASSDDAASTDAARADGSGSCPDDAREDDDTRESANGASPVYSLTGSTALTGLVACPGDDDFIHGYADCCDDPVGAEVTWDAADGVLEVTVLAPDGSPWPVDDDVTSPGLRRSVETSTAMGHDFVVRVHNPGAAPIAYDATIYARVFGP